jgi:hypothetical protein
LRYINLTAQQYPKGNLVADLPKTGAAAGGAAAGAGAASPSAGATSNLAELQNLFNQFSATLVQLRAITTEGQQSIETARAKPQ